MRHAPEWLTQPANAAHPLRSQAPRLGFYRQPKRQADSPCVGVTPSSTDTRLGVPFENLLAPFTRFSAFRNLAVPQTRFLALSRLYTVLTLAYKTAYKKLAKTAYSTKVLGMRHDVTLRR